MDTTAVLLHEILIPSLWAFLWFGATLSSLLGLGLLFSPETTRRISHALNRWISFRRALKPLELPKPQEQRIYRHHQIYGGLIFFGGIYILYMLNFVISEQLVTRAFVGITSPVVASWLAESLMWMLYLAGIFALPFGFVIYLRPSLLKGVESWSNRWISTRVLLRFLDIPHYSMEQLTERYPRLTGSLLLLFGLILILLLVQQPA